MADIIIVRRNCSFCVNTEDSPTNEFDTIVDATITLGEDTVRWHVCEDCRVKFFTELLAAGERVLTTSKKAKKAKKVSVGGEFKCRHCPRTFAKSQGRGRHEAAMHPGEVHLKVTPATQRKVKSA